MRYNLDTIDTSGTGATPLALSRWISVKEGSSMSDAPVILVGRYGDGYAQYAPDGINNAPTKWSLIFVPLNLADWTNMKTFYKNVGCSEWFYGTMPGDTAPLKWRIDKGTWNPTPINQELWRVQFAVTQMFDGGI